MKRAVLVPTMVLTLIALLVSWPVPNQAQIPPTNQLVAESALLNGLAAGLQCVLHLIREVTFIGAAFE